jgi:hypothetical protein
MSLYKRIYCIYVRNLPMNTKTCRVPHRGNLLSHAAGMPGMLSEAGMLSVGGMLCIGRQVKMGLKPEQAEPYLTCDFVVTQGIPGHRNVPVLSVRT